MTALVLALAATMAAAPAGRLELTSDELSVEPGVRIALATGHVDARSAEMEVTCERGQALYDPPSAGHPRQIERLDASGQVHLVRRLDGLVADARKATWERATDRMVLVGDAVVRRGKDVLRGTKITVLFGSDGYDVEGPDVTLDRSARGPAEVTATQLAVRDGGRSARFTGDVQLTQGELAAHGDRLDASLDGSGADAQTLSRLVLSGRVRLAKGAMTATSRTATYDAATGDLALEGAPRVESAGDVLDGERIVINGQTGRAQATRAVAHVRATR